MSANLGNLLKRIGLEVAEVPVDTTGAAVTSYVFSLKDYERIVFLIQQGAWAGGTPAVTLTQATAIAGVAKALSLDHYYTKLGGQSAATWTETDVTSDTFNLTATANTVTAIEVCADDLDVVNGYDCVILNIASPGSNADLICVTAILGDPRYSGATMPDPKVD